VADGGPGKISGTWDVAKGNSPPMIAAADPLRVCSFPARVWFGFGRYLYALSASEAI
jgi:hypothetical protein